MTDKPIPFDINSTINYNGVETKIIDLPSRTERAMLGYGHGPLADQRDVIDGDWPYTPDTCLFAEASNTTRWIENGRTLVCTGCGLDCT